MRVVVVIQHEVPASRRGCLPAKPYAEGFPGSAVLFQVWSFRVWSFRDGQF
jgi:hypothetical protein